MRSAKEYRTIAKERLSGNYGIVIGVDIIYTIILNILSIPSRVLVNLSGALASSGFSSYTIFSNLLAAPITIVISILSTILSVGVTKVVFDVSKKERGDFATLFYGFFNNPVTVICMALWTFVYYLPPILVFLAGMGFSAFILVFFDSRISVIAGIAVIAISSIVYIIWMTMVSYSVSMSYFLYFDNPGMRARDIVRKSVRLMKGRRMQLFRLHLSYLGYYLLGLLSCGLALLWVTPNVSASSALFYQDLISADDPDASFRPFMENENSPGGSEDGSIPVTRESNTSYHQNYWN